MAVARVACSLHLHVETYTAYDSIDIALSEEAKRLVAATANAQAAGTATAPAGSGGKAEQLLNPDKDKLSQETPQNPARPTFNLLDIAPSKWSFAFNRIRRASTAEFTFPLALLPMPPEAIKIMSVTASIRQISDADWADAIDDVGTARAVGNASATADFEGVVMEMHHSVPADGIPMITVKCHDYMALLTQEKVPTGKEISGDIPVTEAIHGFLIGTQAESLDVVWVDTRPEPNLGDHMPKAQAKKVSKKGHKPKKAAPAFSKQSHADVIVSACMRIGIAIHVHLSTIQVAFAGTLFEGQATGSKASLLVGQIIESFEAQHTFVGVKKQPVQVCSYNPDTGQQHTFRWPPDPKGVAPVVVTPGQPPRLPPLQANVGLPGFEQLGESVLLVPIGPVSDPSLLPQVAKSYFLERTRQAVKYTLKTHAPWSDPTKPDDQGGDLLRLRAGDRVTFGYRLDEDSRGLLAPAVEVLSGSVGEDGIKLLLLASGVPAAAAANVAKAITTVPRLSTFVVDENHISGGAGQDPEVELRITNVTQIVADVQAKAEQRTRAEVEAHAVQKVADLAVATADQVAGIVQAAYEGVMDLVAADAKATLDKLDGLFQKALSGKGA